MRTIGVERQVGSPEAQSPDLLMDCHMASTQNVSSECLGDEGWGHRAAVQGQALLSGAHLHWRVKTMGGRFGLPGSFLSSPKAIFWKGKKSKNQRLGRMVWLFKAL